jgi:hypothetical protein
MIFQLVLHYFVRLFVGESSMLLLIGEVFKTGLGTEEDKDSHSVILH